MKIKPFHSLEESILLLQQIAQQRPISVGQILRTLSGRGQALVLIVLSLPFCLPLQIPGLSVPFGLGIALIGLRRAFGKRIWLPQRLLAHTVEASRLQKITDKMLVLVRKMKRWVHPRLNGVCHGPAMRVVNGLAISLAGILLSLPLPVFFTNLTPAWSIFLIALGIFEDDGLFVLLGHLVLVATMIILIGVVFLFV